MAVQDWFDEARFGLFVHWGHYARSGWEASWPMVGGSVVLPEGQSMNVEIYHANARGWVPDMGAPERWVAAAAAAGVAVELSVLKANPAQRLYARLGFRVVGEEERAYTLRWTPPRAAKA